MNSKKTAAQPPEKLTGIELTKIPKSAAGVKAIQSSIEHISKEVGQDIGKNK